MKMKMTNSAQTWLGVFLGFNIALIVFPIVDALDMGPLNAILFALGLACGWSAVMIFVSFLAGEEGTVEPDEEQEEEIEP